MVLFYVGKKVTEGKKKEKQAQSHGVNTRYVKQTITTTTHHHHSC
jgi:hypothetical protein